MPTDFLRSWIETHVPGIPVRITHDHQPVEDSICITLCDIGPVERIQRSLEDHSRRRRIQLRMTYRVTAPFAVPETGHRVLGDIMFAALEHPLMAGRDGDMTSVEILSAASARDRFGPRKTPGLYLEIADQRILQDRPALPVQERVVVARPTPPARGIGTR